MKRVRRTIRKFLLSPVVICFAVVLLASELSSQHRLSAAEDQPLVGQTVRATLPGGDTVDTRFVTPSQIQWKVVSGPRQGQEGQDVITIERIGPQQFFVNRIESATGDTVSEVYDTQVKRLWTYRTRLNPGNVLKRHQEVETARLELIKE